MKRARVAVLAVALIAGLLAAYLALNLSGPSTPPPAVEVETAPALKTTDVLVAAKNIPVGTTVDASAFEWRTWPEDGAATAYIVKSKRPNAVTELTGTIARSSFFAGEPVTEAKLVHTDRGFLSAILPPGKVAVATPISAQTGAGGFILPNDHVDVIMTRQVAATQNANGAAAQAEQKLVPETILSNVRVLAIDQQVMDQDGKQVVVGQTATLELSPQQAEILAVAQRMSDRLTLALRSLADAQNTGQDAHDLIGTAMPGSRAVTVVRNGVSREVEAGR